MRNEFYVNAAEEIVFLAWFKTYLVIIFTVCYLTKGNVSLLDFSQSYFFDMSFEHRR